jgi:hypothetical protein
MRMAEQMVPRTLASGLDGFGSGVDEVDGGLAW